MMLSFTPEGFVSPLLLRIKALVSSLQFSFPSEYNLVV